MTFNRKIKGLLTFAFEISDCDSHMKSKLRRNH